MKTKMERFGLGLILAPVLPLAGLLVFWWTALAFLPETWIPFAASAGLLLGILVDILVLKKLLDRWPGIWLWEAVFLFYSIGVFGFFMGVPVFNTLLAIPAGFVTGSRMAAERANQPTVRKAARRTAWFTTTVLALVCSASAIIALVSPSTASDLRGMFGLSFEVTQGMLVALILVGGVALLMLSWGLSVASVRFTYFFLQRKT